MMDHETWSRENVQSYITGRVESEADRYVVDILRRLQPDTVLEVGSGPGVVRNRCSFVSNYISTDLTEHFLTAQAGDSPGTPLVCCSTVELPFRNGFADCVVAMAVLHHLDTAPLSAALREIYRVLRMGGVFVLMEDWCFTAGESPFEEEARKSRFKFGTRENHLARGTWIVELSAHGFICENTAWVHRPFHCNYSHLSRFPVCDRKVRMCCFEAVRY